MVKVIIKDKKDMRVLGDIQASEKYTLMGSQDEISFDTKIEVLSVKFSKIGQKTFDAYPNLKWIICRSHGYDNIRADLAEKHNVGIVCTNPHTTDVAEWMVDKVQGKKCLVFGAGRIAKKFCEIYDGETRMINSRTEFDPNISKDYDTIVLACSPTKTPILTDKLLENFNGGVVSISRGCTIDNMALEGHLGLSIKYAEIDILDHSKYRDSMIKDSEELNYHYHTAWGDDKSYGDVYFKELFREIELCLKSKSENVVQDRRIDFFDF